MICQIDIIDPITLPSQFFLLKWSFPPIHDAAGIMGCGVGPGIHLISVTLNCVFCVLCFVFVWLYDVCSLADIIHLSVFVTLKFNCFMMLLSIWLIATHTHIYIHTIFTNWVTYICFTYCFPAGLIRDDCVVSESFDSPYVSTYNDRPLAMAGCDSADLVPGSSSTQVMSSWGVLCTFKAITTPTRKVVYIMHYVDHTFFCLVVNIYITS